MTPEDLMHDLRGRINLRCAEVIGTESHERKQCADAIELLIVQRDQLAAKLAEVEAERDELKLESVKNILLSISPGDDGMGIEVFAKSVEDVVLALTNLSNERGALKARLEGGIRSRTSKAHYDSSDKLVWANNEDDDKYNNSTIILDEGVTL